MIIMSHKDKLSIERLAQGIEFHSEAIAEIALDLIDGSHRTIANFIAKYEEFVNLQIIRIDNNQHIFRLGASSQKEIARICDIMLEDIDVIDLEILTD
jgi:hypothetical protein